MLKKKYFKAECVYLRRDLKPKYILDRGGSSNSIVLPFLIRAFQFEIMCEYIAPVNQSKREQLERKITPNERTKLRKKTIEMTARIEREREKEREIT